MATKKTASKEVKVQAPASNQLPSTMGADFAQYAGGGMETADRESFAIPFLAIMQKGSPQVDKDDDAYISGAEVGDLLLTTSGEIFKDEEGVDVVYCGYRRVYLRWAPKDTGGGFKGEVSPDVVQRERAAGHIVEDEGKLFANNGDLIKDTRIHYVLVIRPDGSIVQAVQSFSSTQIKKSKMLMTQLQSFVGKDKDNKPFTPPMFAHVFHAETVSESNDKGSWRGWKLTRKDWVHDADLFKAAAAFYEAVKGEDVKVDYAGEAGTQESETANKKF